MDRETRVILASAGAALIAILAAASQVVSPFQIPETTARIAAAFGKTPEKPIEDLTTSPQRKFSNPGERGLVIRRVGQKNELPIVPPGYNPNGSELEVFIPN